MLLWIGAALAADCENTVGVGEVERLVIRAKENYGPNPDEFQRAMDVLAEDIECLDEVVPRHVAADIHILMGLYKKGWSSDGDAARLAYAAARAADPSVEDPGWIDGEDDFYVWGDWRAVPTVYGASEAVDTSADAVWFDGRPSGERPVSWPSIAQVEAGGEVTTTYLWPDAELLVPPPEGPGLRQHAPLITGLASVVALGSGLGMMYGTASDYSFEYHDGCRPADGGVWDDSCYGAASEANTYQAGVVLAGLGTVGVSTSIVWSSRRARVTSK